MEAHPAGEPPTHYEVLGLTPSLLDAQHDPSTLIKRAYHRALLRHHPDKAQDSLPSPRPEKPASFTVDQITTALAVLSSPRQRATYDAGLRVSRSQAPGAGSGFQTGVADVDLDDLDFDEAAGCWFRSCRCGNARAYSFREEDLVEAGDEGELMVGCQDCSLWLRVHFAVVEDESETAAENNNKS